jgi:hypothetical protein
MPTKRRSYSRTGTTRRSATYGSATRSGAGYSPVKFSNTRSEISAKISSFRTINQQFSGAGKVTAFSPSGATKWVNLINGGCRVYKFNSAQFSRICGPSWQTSPTTTAAFRTLKRKFGTGIKAVTRGKGATWLVAASANVSARPFSSYSFK